MLLETEDSKSDERFASEDDVAFIIPEGDSKAKSSKKTNGGSSGGGPTEKKAKTEERPNGKRREDGKP